MAKDGTQRGGVRIGSGQKPKSKKKTEILLTDFTDVDNLESPDNLNGVDVPPIKEFLKAKQKDGKDLYAEEVFNATFLWLKKRGCEKLVSTQLLEQYAMSVSRWIQCEEAISNYGFLAKHPTTGAAIASPYVQMSQSYMKQINTIWYSIYSIIKDNDSADIEELEPQDVMMEKLLKQKRSKN